MPNDRSVYPVYEVIQEAGVPALFHTGQTGAGAGTRGGGGIRLAYSNPIHLDAAAAQRLGVADRPVNQGPSTMAMAANMALAAFPGSRLTSLRTRLLGLVLAEDGVEGGGDVTGHEIVNGQERVRCQLYLEVPGRGRVLEGEAVLVLPAADGHT